MSTQAPPSVLKSVPMTLKSVRKGKVVETTYTLIANHNAIRVFEITYGQPLSIMATDPTRARSISATTAFLFALLQRHHPEFRNEAMVSALIDDHLEAGGDSEALSAATLAAMQNSHFWPKPATEEEAEGNDAGKAPAPPSSATT